MKKLEGELILKTAGKANLLVLLDDKGKMLSSQEFAGWVESHMNRGIRELAFVSGGAWGFSDEVYQSAQEKLSLSRMTFTHQMVRLIFCEQLYRAFTILKGMPYHNE